MAIKKLVNVEQEGENLSSSNDNVSSISKIEGYSNPLWGGHFARGTNELVNKMNSTISSDKRFYSVAIESIKAQLKMHTKRNIIQAPEATQLITILDTMKKDIVSGSFEFKDDHKDIYYAIELYVTEKSEKSLDTLRKCFRRNSQTAGDLKLWIRDAYNSLDSAIQNLQAALIDKAEENVKSIFPGNCHSQLTQPVSLGHHLLGYVEMLGRDRSRILDARVRTNESSYSSANISGSSFNYNIEMPSRVLGFSNASTNSVDAICARDYAIEFMATTVNAITNLSRLSADLITWHSTSKKFIEFSNAFVAQSDVLPYRRDPEALEMIRAKSATICGAFTTTTMIVKGLPMEYSGDYREISAPIVSSYDDLLNCLNTMAAMVADFTTNRKKMKEAASQDFSTTIDLVEWLMQNVTPSQSEAEEISRKVVEYAITKGKKLSLLELSELQKIEPKINNDIYSALIPSRAMISRRSGNGSNPVQIRKAVRAARRKFI